MITFCVNFSAKLESLGMTLSTWKIKGTLNAACYTYPIGGGDVVGPTLALRILASNALGLLHSKWQARDISLDINPSTSLRHQLVFTFLEISTPIQYNFHSDWKNYSQIVLCFKYCVTFHGNLFVIHVTPIPLSFLFSFPIFFPSVYLFTNFSKKCNLQNYRKSHPFKCATSP